ncbi:hypothetical protein FUSO6_12620 [Fusobacterium necrophorum DAB]|nr:hypothetical protein FUSO6_12620 [Fusobacterium necrophorum DAB]
MITKGKIVISKYKYFLNKNVEKYQFIVHFFKKITKQNSQKRIGNYEKETQIAN